MLTVISPAKRLDFTPQSLHAETSRPEHLAQSKRLIAQLRKFSPKQLGKRMGISDKLATEVHGYFSDWKAKYDCVGAKQAILAFRGDVYLGIDADGFTAKEFDFAQDHLRILSGLYGVLSPLDLIQPYRLEMGTPLSGDHGKDLYDFWGEKIARSLKKAMAAQGGNVLVNLASNEYFKAARAKTLGCQVITPVFKDRHKGEYKVLSFFAKKARGMMVQHIVRKQLTDASGLESFRMAGYKFNRKLSSEHKPVFTREQAPTT